MPATTDFLPTREADLVVWTQNLSDKINLSPASYGLVAQQCTDYKTLNDAFVSAWNLANHNDTRTPSVIQTKNDAKEALIGGEGGIRHIVNIIQAFPGTTNTERMDLGLRVRDTEPSPIAPPAVAPGIDIISAVGRTVKIRLHDAATPSSRARPDGVKGAAVFSFVGVEPPDDIESWKFMGNTAKSVFDVDFPTSVEAGSKVWLTAYWFNPRVQAGPPCPPVTTNLPGGLAAAA